MKCMHCGSELGTGGCTNWICREWTRNNETSTPSIIRFLIPPACVICKRVHIRKSMTEIPQPSRYKGCLVCNDCLGKLLDPAIDKEKNPR